MRLYELAVGTRFKLVRTGRKYVKGPPSKFRGRCVLLGEDGQACGDVSVQCEVKLVVKSPST